ncbi:MAG: hypothetical protein ACMG6E_05280, partial [Candidatus Roizmanbacteria bacterium]
MAQTETTITLDTCRALIWKHKHFLDMCFFPPLTTIYGAVHDEDGGFKWLWRGPLSSECSIQTLQRHFNLA